MNNRSNYREYKRTDGQKGDTERMKCLEIIESTREQMGRKETLDR
jgi:hypothetical protein